MRYLLIAAMLLAFVTFFSQCKKNNPPAPPQKNSEISPGYYIIRTKYMCSDGRAFVLGSFSNHEVLGWYRASPAELKSIKEDGAFESNTFIWKVGESIVHGPGIAGIPPPANVAGAIPVFSIYQEDVSDPNDPLKWYIPTPEENNNPDDNTGYGIGPSYRASQATFSEEDLNKITIAMTYLSNSDSTGRLAAWARPFWWYIALPTDPDDVCDDFNNAVIWRNSWLCPNTSVIGNAWKSDACAISQLVFEKVD